MAIFLDDFNRADGALSGDNGWVANAGTWSIVGNTAQMTASAADNQNTIVRDYAATNGTYSVILAAMASPAAGVGLCFRSVDNANNWVVDAGTSTGQTAIYYRSGGNYTLAAQTSTWPGWAVGDKMSIRLNEDLIELLRNDVVVLSVNSTVHQGGSKHGLRQYNGTNVAGQVSFDDFYADYTPNTYTSSLLTTDDKPVALETISESIFAAAELGEDVDVRQSFLTLTETLSAHEFTGLEGGAPRYTGQLWPRGEGYVSKV